MWKAFMQSYAAVAASKPGMAEPGEQGGPWLPHFFLEIKKSSLFGPPLFRGIVMLCPSTIWHILPPLKTPENPHGRMNNTTKVQLKKLFSNQVYDVENKLLEQFLHWRYRAFTNGIGMILNIWMIIVAMKQYSCYIEARYEILLISLYTGWGKKNGQSYWLVTTISL